jgi:uncharacterized protein (DUF488 family)
MNTVYTIGHSNLPIERFVRLLHENKIELIVDIRSVPYSRFNPHFNKTNLERSLHSAEIGYVFDGGRLGGRITDPECYIARCLPESNAHPAELVDFAVLEKKPWFAAGIEELVRAAGERRTAIMCGEENPDRCHRKLLVGRKLASLGIEVFHLRSKTGTDGPDLFDDV